MKEFGFHVLRQARLKKKTKSASDCKNANKAYSVILVLSNGSKLNIFGFLDCRQNKSQLLQIVIDIFSPFPEILIKN